jgi:predicted  nucleic acid-binding Zn-ribbon protein
VTSNTSQHRSEESEDGYPLSRSLQLSAEVAVIEKQHDHLNYFIVDARLTLADLKDCVEESALVSQDLEASVAVFRKEISSLGDSCKALKATIKHPSVLSKMRSADDHQDSMYCRVEQHQIDVPRDADSPINARMRKLVDEHALQLKDVETFYTKALCIQSELVSRTASQEQYCAACTADSDALRAQLVAVEQELQHLQSREPREQSAMEAFSSVLKDSLNDMGRQVGRISFVV